METTNRKQELIIKALSVIVALLLVTLIILAFFFGTQYTKKIHDKAVPICTTQACLSAANTILQNMEPSVDPCDDFYEFSCGRFIKNQRIPDDTASVSWLGALEMKLAYDVSELLEEPLDEDEILAVKNAKILYESCINETQIELIGEEKLLNYLNQSFDGWPILNGVKWNENNYDPIKTQIELSKLGFASIVNVYIMNDPKSPLKNTLAINQPNWFFPKLFYGEESLIEAYKELIYRIVRYLNMRSSDSEIKMQVNEMIAIEKSFGLLTLQEDQRRNNTFKKMTIKELSDQIPDFNWKKYIIDGMFASVENVNITENETIIVEDWDYLVNAAKLYAEYAKTKKKNLKNMLLWTFVKESIDFLPKYYKEAQQAFNRVYKGVNGIEPRKKFCASYVTEQMGFAVSTLYVIKHFNSNSKLAALEMIKYISDAFKIMIKKSDWMDNTSKQLALDKADYIESLIGYPEYLFNATYMDELYKGFNFSREEFLENVIKLLTVNNERNLKTLRKEVDRSIWMFSPTTVNAMYMPNLNQIWFPAAILQPPFFDASYPNYLNYGAIGSIIGHEITHGFDDQGRLHDKNGIYFSDGEDGLWSNSTIEKYKERSKCIIDQYSNFTVELINKNINGFQTQGENIADNGGLKEAFYGYQNWVKNNKPEALLPGMNFTQNQLFFISNAQIYCSKSLEQYLFQQIIRDVHSPSKFRVVGPTSNFIEFAETFNCKANTRSNPEKKCSVW